MKGIKYNASAGFSGYAEWSKNLLWSLRNKLNIQYNPITVDRTIQFDEQNEMDVLLNKLSQNKVNYNIVVHHFIPQGIETLYEQGKINIIITIWETDKLCDEWVSLSNKMDAVIVPSQWNKEVFINSGVKRPIYVIPFVYETSVNVKATIPNLDMSDYVFYTIGQWSKRKNIDTTIDFFCRKFTAADKVCLVVKTYSDGFSENSKNFIRNEVEKIISKYTSPPRIILLLRDFNKKEIQALHCLGHCYLSLAKGEGWGMGAYEAALSGKLVIMSDYGAQKEFLNNDLLVETKMGPVDMLEFPWYKSDMNWGYPKYESFSEKIDLLMNKKDLLVEDAKQNVAVLKEKFDEEKIAEMFLNIIKKYGK